MINNPLDLITILKMDPNEKLAIIAVLMGNNDVARIDIFSGKHDAPEKVRQALRSAGLHFCNLVVKTGKSDHLCGIAVARTQELAFQFKIANQTGDRVTMRRLVGDFIISADGNPSEPSYFNSVKRVFREVPTLFYELLLKKPQLSVG